MKKLTKTGTVEGLRYGHGADENGEAKGMGDATNLSAVWAGA
jgi:hypothetical protein